MQEPFVCVWEFQVPPAAEAEFCRRYGPTGSWAQLFRQGAGFVDTLLLKDRSTMGRYLTIDRWESAEAYRAFRVKFADQYAAIDRSSEALTAREQSLGSFSPVIDA